MVKIKIFKGFTIQQNYYNSIILIGISAKYKSSIELGDKVDIFCLSRIVPVKSLVVFGPIKGTIKKGPSETLNLARVDPKSLFLITVSPLSRS